MSKKLYIVEYATKAKRGSREYKKLIEAEDIQSYISKNFILGYSYARGSRKFLCATEVQKAANGRYECVEGGTYWYLSPVTFFQSELKSSKQRKPNGMYFDSKLQKAFSLA